MFEKVAKDGWSGRKLYHWLKFDINFRTKSDKHLSVSNVYIILQNHFYYGRFEYPEKSGNWYTGKHKPLITKELFDKVQEQVKKDYGVRSEIKEFAFTKLITCGHCQSGITAQEKFKKLKDGTFNRHVYYGCCRSKNLNCKGGYIREDELLRQFSKIMDTIDINEISMRKKLEIEADRLNKFINTFLKDVKGINKIKIKKVDLRSYAKYILAEGSVIEKRELLGCIKSRFVMKNKILTLQK